MLNFGKYKGQSLASIVQSDPKYILWLGQQDFVDESTIERIQMLVDRIILPFGKHCGLTINQLRNTDPDYLAWLFKNSRLK